jgi:hypothetical protein
LRCVSDAARRKKVLEGEVLYFVPPAAAGQVVSDMLREVAPLAGARVVPTFDAATVTLAIAAPGTRDADRRRVAAAGGVLHTPEVLLSALVSQRLDKSANRLD